MALAKNTDFNFNVPYIGWAVTSGDGEKNGIDWQGNTYNNAEKWWWSQMYRIGHPYKITKIRVPLAERFKANQQLNISIFRDDNSDQQEQKIFTNTDYNNKRALVWRPNNMTGDHNFWMEIQWTGSAICTVNLPIVIEYELIGDD